MPSITLASHLVAYNLYDKLHTVNPQIPRSVAELSVQFPDANFEAANVGGSTVKVGHPNDATTPTSIAQVEHGLLAGEDWTIGAGGNVNDISLTEKWVQASVDNAVLYVGVAVL